jgi:hypothetical protein
MHFDPHLSADASNLEDDEIEETAPGPAALRAALRRATHGFCDAEHRWSALRREGADDSTLQRHLGFEFGSYGGCSSPIWHQHYGGQNPRLIVGSGPKAITVSGSRLLRLARSVLEIPEPDEALQGRLF